MKIKKFNEKKGLKEYDICVIIDNIGPNILKIGIFETKKDMENWLLNFINGALLDNHYENEMIKRAGKGNGVEINEDGDSVFIDLVEALNWYQEEYNCEVVYDNKSNIYSNIKLKYGVDLLKSTKKYNM
jgi:hypothetical protein